MNKILLLILILINTVVFASLEDLKLIYENHNHTLGLKFYSQYEQDRFLYQKFFKDVKNGVFVDIGAHDGISFSNSYFFEQTLDWTGICIEPIPEVYALLKKRRKAICIEGCICSKWNTVPFLRYKGDREMFSGIIDPSRFSYDQNDFHTKFGDTAEIITVKCFDLTQLLLEYGITHVNYLSLDTEGGELDILKSIDFNLIEIDVIGVENNISSSCFRDFLIPLGYKKVIGLGVDEIFVRAELCKDQM